MQHKPFSIAPLIYGSLKESLNKKICCLPSLITKLCMQAGLLPLKGEQPIHGSPINTRIWKSLETNYYGEEDIIKGHEEHYVKHSVATKPKETSSKEETSSSQESETPPRETTKSSSSATKKPVQSSSSVTKKPSKPIPTPSKTQKGTPLATEGKTEERSPLKRPQKLPIRRGERSSQRLKSSFSSLTKGSEGTTSEKPITLSEPEDSEDDVPLIKRLKRNVVPASQDPIRETSPGNLETPVTTDVPLSQASPQRAPTPEAPQQPSPPRQEEGRQSTEGPAAAAPEQQAAEKQVAEQEQPADQIAQPPKQVDKGKGKVTETAPAKKKIVVPREINLGGPTSSSFMRPDTSGDEALARALAAAEEEQDVPPVLEEHEQLVPLASIPESSTRQPPIQKQAPTSSKTKTLKKRKQPSSPIPAIPLAARRKSQIGIAEIFEMLGNKIAKLLPEQPTPPEQPVVPQIQHKDPTEEIQSLRNDISQLTAAFNKFQEMQKPEKEDKLDSLRSDISQLTFAFNQFKEQQKTEREGTLRSIKTTIRDIHALPSPATQQAVRNEIRSGANSLMHAHSLHNTRTELKFARQLSIDAQEREFGRKALETFGTYLQEKLSNVEDRLGAVEVQLKISERGKKMARESTEHLIAVIRELLVLSRKWLPDAEFKKLSDQLEDRPLTQEELDGENQLG